ncbi:MAG: hypothetical protein ACLUKQ_06835 [Peptococcaceae bacterium]
MKSNQVKQILNLQQQITAMEKEIEHLYAERKLLVQESDALLSEVLQEKIQTPLGLDYQSELDVILDAHAELPKAA